MADKGQPKKLSLEEQVSDILLNLSKGQPLQTPQKRKQVIDEVLTDLRTSFLKCTVLSYGLDEIGISEDSTSLYLSVDTYGKIDTEKKMLHGHVTDNAALYSAHIAPQVFKILTSNPSSYQYVSIRSLTVHANTSFGNLMPTPLPEISFTHCRTRASCKIRFENYLSVQKTRLFNFYSRVDVRFWPLLMIVRHWGTKHEALGSADTLDFQNYAICLLLVHFLISKKIIPSVENLQSAKDSGIDKPFIVNNYEISFCSNLSTIKPPSSVNPSLQDKELRTLSIVSILKQFFAFCAIFNFEENVVCPFLGETFDREFFWPKSDSKKLPESLSAHYLNGPDGKPRYEKLYIKGPLCVQDIFALTSNVTRNVSEDEALKFKMNSLKTAKILENVLNQSEDAVFADIFKEKDEVCVHKLK